MNLEDLTKLIATLRARTDAAYADTPLRDHADRDYVNNFLVKTMLKYFKDFE
jgi:hypothetical protein